MEVMTSRLLEAVSPIKSVRLLFFILREIGHPFAIP